MILNLRKVICVSLILLCFLSTVVSAQDIKTQTKSKKEKRLEKQNKVFKIVDTFPVFPGGEEECNAFIFDNLILPDSLQTTNSYVRVLLNFIVEKDGSLTNLKILPGSFKQLGDELIRIFKMMPKWKAGSHKGIIRRVNYAYRVVIPTGIVTNGELVNKVDKMPSFPGGEMALLKFLNTNIDYPRTARDMHIQGRVQVSFIIETDGSLSNIKIFSGIGGGCDEESLRVVKLMPHWIPAEKNGEVIRVLYTLPVRFVLE